MTTFEVSRGHKELRLVAICLPTQRRTIGLELYG